MSFQLSLLNAALIYRFCRCYWNVFAYLRSGQVLHLLSERSRRQNIRLLASSIFAQIFRATNHVELNGKRRRRRWPSDIGSYLMLLNKSSESAKIVALWRSKIRHLSSDIFVKFQLHARTRTPHRLKEKTRNDSLDLEYGYFQCFSCQRGRSRRC